MRNITKKDLIGLIEEATRDKEWKLFGLNCITLASAVAKMTKAPQQCVELMKNGEDNIMKAVKYTLQNKKIVIEHYGERVYDSIVEAGQRSIEALIETLEQLLWFGFGFKS